MSIALNSGKDSINLSGGKFGEEIEFRDGFECE